MDFYTKLFLVNIVTMFFSKWFDREILDDAVEKSSVGLAFGLWALLTLLSIPAWLMYIIVTW